MTENIHRPDIEQAQKIRVGCTIYAETFRESVRTYVTWSEVTAWLAATVCFVYFVLFSLWSADESIAYSLGIIETLLSSILFVIALYSLFRRWQTKQEFHQGLSIKYLNLLGQLDVELTSDTVTPTKAKKYQREFERIEVERNDAKGVFSRRFGQNGHQHCAKKYPRLKLRCYECDRVWESSFEQQTASFWKLNSWLPWKHDYCKNCGVKLNER